MRKPLLASALLLASTMLPGCQHVHHPAVPNGFLIRNCHVTSHVTTGQASCDCPAGHWAIDAKSRKPVLQCGPKAKRTSLMSPFPALDWNQILPEFFPDRPQLRTLLCRKNLLDHALNASNSIVSSTTRVALRTGVEAAPAAEVTTIGGQSSALVTYSAIQSALIPTDVIQIKSLHPVRLITSNHSKTEEPSTTRTTSSPYAVPVTRIKLRSKTAALAERSKTPSNSFVINHHGWIPGAGQISAAFEFRTAFKVATKIREIKFA